MTSPQNVDSKFRFILVAAKRARQLQAGAKSMVQTVSKKPTRVAQSEVEAGLVPYENIKPESEENGKAAKAKAAK
jgi:DNA-directed RNA polymerase subunit omega